MRSCSDVGKCCSDWLLGADISYMWSQVEFDQRISKKIGQIQDTVLRCFHGTIFIYFNKQELFCQFIVYKELTCSLLREATPEWGVWDDEMKRFICWLFFAHIKMFSMKYPISKALGIESSLRRHLCGNSPAGWNLEGRVIPLPQHMELAIGRAGQEYSGHTKISKIHPVVLWWNLWVSFIRLYTGVMWPVNEEPGHGW